VAFPFMPMTNEMLKKLSRTIQDSNQTINIHDLHAVFVSQAFNTVLELNPHHVETDQSDISTDNLL
jgi:hypothetical protein